MDILSLIISLISGAAGGNIAGAVLPEDKNLGTIGNTIAGLIGGGAGEFILKALGVLGTATAAGGAAAPQNFDIATIISSIAAGGISGGALTAIVGLLKDLLKK